MIALIQRVLEARVTVAGQTVGEIGPGLLALLAVEKGDAPANAARMVERLLGYRVFSDAEGRMNLSLADTAGELLLVSQFTLAADTAKGMRPSFTPAATPEDAERLFNEVVALAKRCHPKVATGVFGAEMSVSLINHGPVTFRLTA
ncbi:MAG: D-tyrosyl-tRNA(Tyr) deacylase [Zoogloea sp.]|uniref:D-aminoacyl-tRNA deacylase n=1 Tax=Zoogloea sp. TaxID=49181 RepID=UPI001B52AB61|nr:D-aminoacyl-tRNA deacylase [Zoogloea sp.]MBP7394197.1 D-tyrosyl-tRNA(Tyr) deacylase [Zoogloea sp.]